MVAVVPQQSKWGIWASGDVTLGDESGANTLSGFHSTLGSPTLGFDYRVAPNLVIGVLGSYTTGDANFDDGSTIGINTEIAALYGTWRDGNWHVNGIAGGGTLQLNDTRTTFGGDTASSTPRGDDILTDWTGGYDFHLGDRWNITPEVGLQYTHLDISSFTETGAGTFDLNEGDQNIDSLRSHVGFNLDKAYSLGKDLTFIPELRALWYHEFLDSNNDVSTSLPGAPALGSFNVTSLPPQRDFALVGVGLNTAFTGCHGVPIGLFINYNAQVGQSDYIANSVNASIRVDF
jgi:outer membrane autotransporter protein